MAEQSKTVDAALSLLAALRDDNGDTSTAELARRHNLSRTATARLLATLEAHDLATRTPAGWALGQGLLGLARHVPGNGNGGDRGGGVDDTTETTTTTRTTSATGGGHAPLPTGR
jgi:IclR helix-turn-helix domain